MIIKKILKISIIAITTMTCQLMSSENMQVNDTLQPYMETNTKLFDEMDEVHKAILTTTYIFFDIDHNTANYDNLKNIVNNILYKTNYYCNNNYAVELAIKFYKQSIDELKKLENLTEDEKDIVDVTVDDCKKLIDINEQLRELKHRYITDSANRD